MSEVFTGNLAWNSHRSVAEAGSGARRADRKRPHRRAGRAGQAARQSRRNHRRQGIDRRAGIRRSARAPARAGTGAQGNHRQRHGGGGGRRIHLGVRHAEHHAGERPAGDHALDAGRRARRGGERVSDSGRHPRQPGREAHQFCRVEARRRRGRERRRPSDSRSTTSCARRWRRRKSWGFRSSSMPKTRAFQKTIRCTRERLRFAWGCADSRSESEWRLVERDVTLARQTEAHVHVAHVSTAVTLDVVREARASGVNVTCEVTPHHFMLTDVELLGYDTNYKMNPPLRDRGGPAGAARRIAGRHSRLPGHRPCAARAL